LLLQQACPSMGVGSNTTSGKSCTKAVSTNIGLHLTKIFTSGTFNFYNLRNLLNTRTGTACS
jgi:hypothetical protein